MLTLQRHWVWDSWSFTEPDGTHHLYFLKAPRALRNPVLRHSHSVIGHAVSHDWRSWTELPDALLPSAGPGWDDLTVWTGSVIQGPRRFHLFYTGTSREQGISVQRIGRADSSDLIHWERFGELPLVTADPRWYEGVDGRTAWEQTWRDPWVQAAPDGKGWHMFLTARVPGDGPGRGVVGHAVSSDLDHWDVLPPRSEAGPFDHLEVVQPTLIDGQHGLLMSCDVSALHPGHHPVESPGGVYLLPGDGPLGPWDADAWRRIDHPWLYAPRLVDDNGEPALLGFRNIENERFVGEIADPVRVRLAP
ncbi:MAG: glycosyl hydrolase family 32 [Ornithinimicrobium sp.]